MTATKQSPERRRNPEECPYRPPYNPGYPGGGRGNFPGPNPGPEYPERDYPMGRGVSPFSIARCVYPAVEHGLNEVKTVGLKHAFEETAMISYLMGMGFNYYTAYNIFESWENSRMY